MAATNQWGTMSNIYQDYNELSEFFGADAFESFDVDSLATLSSDALLRLQGLIMQALAKQLKEKN